MGTKVTRNLGSNTKKVPKYKKSKKSKVARKPRHRARTWFITINNPLEKTLAQLDQDNLFPGREIIKLLAQDEIGEEKNVYHIHIAVQFKGTIEFNTLKKLLPRARIESSKSLNATFIYCGKLRSRQFKRWHIGDVAEYVEMPPPTYENIRKELLEDLGYTYHGPTCGMREC